MRPVGAHPFQPGKNPREWPEESRHGIGDHRKTERCKARWIAVGADDQILDLRPRPRDGTREQRLSAEHEQRLVAAAHAAGLAAGEDDTDCVRRRCQNRPTILPSGPTSMESAEGTFGRPGMVMISPQIATTNSAPADSRTSRTLIV